MASKMSIRKGDTVEVLTGKDRGKRGKVLRVIPAKDRVVVDGVNIAKKHERPTRENPQGGVVESPAPIVRSNVMTVCGSCNKPTRVGSKLVGDRQVRVCRKCGAEL